MERVIGASNVKSSSSDKSSSSGDVDPYTKERVAVYHPEEHFKIVGKQSPLRSQLHRFLRVWQDFKCCDERDEPSKEDDWTADPNKSKPDAGDSKKTDAPTPAPITGSMDDKGAPVEIVQYCGYGSFNYFGPNYDSDNDEEEEKEVDGDDGDESDMDMDSETETDGNSVNGRPRRKGRKKELPPDYVDPTLSQHKLLEQQQKKAKVPRKGLGKRCYYTLNDLDSQDLKNVSVPQEIYDTQEFLVYGENLKDYQEAYPEECDASNEKDDGEEGESSGRRASRGISTISKKFPQREDKKYVPPCMYLRGMDRDMRQMGTLFENRGRPRKYFTTFEEVDTDEIYNPADKPVLWDVKNRRVVLCQNKLRQVDFDDFFKGNFKVVQYGDASPDYKPPTRSANPSKLEAAKVIMTIEGTTGIVITGEKYRKARNAAHKWMISRRMHEQAWATSNQSKARFLLNKEVSEAKKRIAIRKHNLMVDHMLRPGQKFKKMTDGSNQFMVYVDAIEEAEKYKRILSEVSTSKFKSSGKGSEINGGYTRVEVAALKAYNPNRDATKRVPMYNSVTGDSLIGMDAPMASDLADFFNKTKNFKILNNQFDRDAVSRHQKAMSDAMTMRARKEEAEKNGWLTGDFSEYKLQEEEYEDVLKALSAGPPKAKRGRPAKESSNNNSSGSSSQVNSSSSRGRASNNAQPSPAISSSFPSSQGNPNAVGKWGEHDIVFESDMKGKDHNSTFWECGNCRRKNPNDSISCPKCGQRRKRDAKPVFRLSPDQHGLKYMSYASVENRNKDGSAGTTYVLSDESRGPGTSFGPGGPPDGMEGGNNGEQQSEWTETLRGRFIVLDEYNGTLLLPCGRSIKQRQNITRHRHSCSECQKMSLEDVLQSCLAHTMPLIISQREANRQKADRKRKNDQKSGSSFEEEEASTSDDENEEDESPAHKRNTRAKRGKGNVDKDEFGIRYAARTGSSSRDGKRYQADIPEMPGSSNISGRKGSGRGRGRPRTVNLRVENDDGPRVMPRRVYERDAYKYLFDEIDRMVEIEEEAGEGSDNDSDKDVYYRTGIDTAMEEELRTEEEKEEDIEAIEDRLQSRIKEMGVNSNRLTELEIQAKEEAAAAAAKPTGKGRPSRTAVQKKDANLEMCGKSPTESAGLLCDLFHASKCPFEEGHCPTCVNCGDSKAVWKHIVKCHDDNCDLVLCRTAKFSLEHFRTCNNKEECLVCSKVRNTLRRRRRRAMEAGKIMRKYLVSIAY